MKVKFEQKRFFFVHGLRNISKVDLLDWIKHLFFAVPRQYLNCNMKNNLKKWAEHPLVHDAFGFLDDTIFC